jgi:hypothetical protein
VSAAAAFSATTDSSGTVSYWLIRQSELGGGYYQAVEQQPGSRILQFTCPSLYTNDAGSWLVGTTYALNAVVRDPATDIPYISLGAGNVGHPPATSPANWALYAGEKITAHPTVGVPPASVAFGQANLLADNAVATGTYAVPPITLQDQLRQLTQIQARHVTAASDTATSDDDVLDLDGTANAVTETLPTAVGWTKLLLLKCINITHAVTVGTTSAQTIDGASTLTPALNAGYLLYSDGANWRIAAQILASTGTVTSVGLTLPSWLTVAGSPITTSGTLAVTAATQTANTGLLGPTTGAAAAPTFRALVTADLPAGAVLPTLGPLGQGIASDGAEPIYAIPQGGPQFVDPGIAQYDLYVRKPAAVTALSAIFIGDSITANFAIPATTATNLSINGLTVTGYNLGVTGTSSTDWNIGGTNDGTAHTSYTTHGARVVIISLGVNDARVAVRNSVATYLSQMAAIAAGWVARGAIVILNVPTYCVPGSNSGDQDATANTLRIGYQTALLQICNGTTVFLGDTKGYGFFASNSGLLTDGIHPGTTGQADLAGLWAAGAQAVFSQLTTPSIQRAVLGANLSASVVGGVVTIAASGGGGGGYAPMVNGDLPGPSPIATTDGQFLMIPLS